ncbi:MAG: GC-type dockerin domain-anchored protein [Phycisphaerales bacterium JB039]
MRQRISGLAAITVLGVATLSTQGTAQCDWSGLGSGAAGRGVRGLAVFDDGGGEELFVGGWFSSAGGISGTSRIAKWNGTRWASVGGGISGSRVYAMTVFDDGTAPALYAGGAFSSAGGVSASNIAKWDGASWSAVGGGLDSDVYCLHVFDDGTGPSLYAGGVFARAGSSSANYVAKWDGASWSPLGLGVGGISDPIVFQFETFDDGSGPALYAAGDFATAGGVLVNHIAKWDGTEWSSLGGGVVPETQYGTRSLRVFDHGSGPALFVGGRFLVAGGVDAAHIARWDGATWAAVGDGVDGVTVDCLTVYNDGSGDMLYASGDFATAGGISASNVASWDGASWSPLGAGISGGFVADSTVYADGAGRALYLGGDFSSAGGSSVNYIAKWSCDTCPADCDGDDELTFFDFLCFQNAFSAGDPAADCDGDGELTFFDFLCFQNAFSAGCP